MPSTYTTNLGIEKIATGEQSGTWGITTNTNFDIVDQAINGVAQVTLASAGTSGSPNTLDISDGSVSDGRNKFIEFVDGGDLGATAYVQLTPNDAEKIVFIRNSLSGSRSLIVFQGTYSASNDFEVPNGKDVLVKFSGGGASATVTDVFAHLQVTALTTPTLTATSAISFSGATVSDLGTVTTANIDGGTIDGVTIGGASPAAGTFTTATATTGNITTVNATTVDTTNIEVTNVKAKDGTASATIADSTGVMTITSAVLTTADINGGTVDSVTIGGTTPAAGTFTTLNANTNLTLATGSTVTAILDEDNMASDSATALATQQSIKAYVDSQVGTVDTLAEILANGNVTGGTNLIVSAGDILTVDTINETTTAAGVTIDSVLLKDDVVNATSIEATNYKANDGTAGFTVANTTGVVTIPSAVLTTADINGGTADNVVIGGTTAAAGTFTTVTATTGNITSVNATTVDTTNIEVTNVKAKDGTAALTIADVTGVVTIPSVVLTTADINGGTADNVVLGGGTPAAITGTTVTANTSLTVNATTTITDILDEDDLVSDSATALATQQSIKAYVDAQVGAQDTLAEILANGNTTGGTNIVVSSGDAITTNTINETTVGAGVTIDSVLLKDDVVNATDVETGSISANDGTASATIANSTGVMTIASSVLTTADINGGTVDNTVVGGTSAAAGSFTTLSYSTSISDGTITITGFVDEDDMASNSPTLVPTQQSVKAYTDTTADNAAVALAIALG